MKYRIIGALCFLAATALSSAGAADFSGETAPPWSERGVFVFGAIVLDFWKHIEDYGPVSAELINCSDSQYYCAKSRFLHIVLPKSCDELSKSDKWTKDGIETDVLDVESEPDVTAGLHRTGSGTLMLLGNPQYPNIVYEYDPAVGVRAFFLDIMSKMNFVEMARNHTILSYGETLMRGNGTHFELMSLDSFGKCGVPSEFDRKPMR